jgi:hypothetical protein
MLIYPQVTFPETQHQKSGVLAGASLLEGAWTKNPQPSQPMTTSNINIYPSYPSRTVCVIKTLGKQ